MESGGLRGTTDYADFSKPGNDGEPLLDAFQWRRGLVYTARSPGRFPLMPGQEYRIAASFKRSMGANEKFGS
jgi:hypothetical protein